MSRTGRLPQLFAHRPEPALEMHPDDAERRGLAGELVRISSKRGQLVLPLALSRELPGGTVFAAMHWNGQFLNSGGINETSQPQVDGQSFQPELKHAAVKVEKISLPWRVTAALRCDDLPAMQARLAPLLRQCRYAAIALHQPDVLLLRAAHEQALDGWLQQLLDVLGLQPGPEVLEYRDDRRGVVKRVAWADGHLAAFVFASSNVTTARQRTACCSNCKPVKHGRARG
jgi:assimilatory nitrate reductase catalytic subunit